MDKLGTLAEGMMKIGSDSFDRGVHAGLTAALAMVKLLADKPEATFAVLIEALEISIKDLKGDL